MPERLKDKIAIITGAGRGIGAQTALRFCEEGAVVVIAELDPLSGEATAADLRSKGFQSFAVQTDVSDPTSVCDMMTEVVKSVGRPDVLVNNAGINLFRDPLELKPSEWRRLFSIDLDGVWWCCQAALPHMLAMGRGSIINVASVHAFQIIPGCFPYPVAKHGVVGLTRALAIEYAAKNIRVNAVCPGYIETQIAIDYWNTFDDPDAERLYTYNIHPPKRIGTADEVAWPIVFLASEEAGFVNGAALMVDGGRSILYHD
ncbi:MAG: SDR family oxidoreductase [Caldilineales bacterium]|nr:SDR family oxidoreductase [Caldilineales bacterium]